MAVGHKLNTRRIGQAIVDRIRTELGAASDDPLGQLVVYQFGNVRSLPAPETMASELPALYVVSEGVKLQIADSDTPIPVRAVVPIYKAIYLMRQPDGPAEEEDQDDYLNPDELMTDCLDAIAELFLNSIDMPLPELAAGPTNIADRGVSIKWCMPTSIDPEDPINAVFDVEELRVSAGSVTLEVSTHNQQAEQS